MIKENFNPLIELINQDINYLDLLPYHTGLEIECKTTTQDIELYFNRLPCLINDHTTGELRVKFNTGINGLCQLYCFCMTLVKYSKFNEGSGIHYNIDTSVNSLIVNDKTDSNIILEELDTWNYKGTYNRRLVGFTKSIWCRVHDNRLEIRIGEMSFDFNFILNRIQSCNKIVDGLLELKGKQRIVEEDYQFDDIKKYLDYIDLLDNFTGTRKEEEKVYKNKTINYYDI